MDNGTEALNRIACALALLASMIRAGEDFTERSTKAYEAAIADIEWVKTLV
jgi:hypothetical protein